jgi:NAD(P)-dependent dehydrogenase (short-subunit alcohol dehydrogenase family)
LRPKIRTSFHHQPEAQHPKFSAIHKLLGRLPHLFPKADKEVFGLHAKARGISWEQFHDLIAGKNHRRRLPTLAEMVNVAAFVASDEASAMSGTTVNLSLGMLDD